MLTNSLNEAIYNYESIQKVLDIYKDAFYNPDLYSEWRTEITSSIAILKEGNFDKFDRYSFIKEHTNIQLELVLKTAKDWNVELSNSRSLDPNATSLFDKNFFNMKIFSMQRTPEITEERIALGKRLFNDKALSSTGTISCATCHIKEKAFTDAHTKALGSNGKELQRNSPTLTYAVYQRSLFYDGRADGLEDQIVGVTNNENEFHIDLEKLEEKIQSKIVYKVQFDSLYGGK